MRDHYPPPHQSKRPHLATSQREPEFGTTVDEWEERIFRVASHFNVVRYGTHNGSEVATVATFPKALALAGNNARALIYAVTYEGRAFCIPSKAYQHYAEIWLSLRRG